MWVSGVLGKVLFEWWFSWLGSHWNNMRYTKSRDPLNPTLSLVSLMWGYYSVLPLRCVLFPGTASSSEWHVPAVWILLYLAYETHLRFTSVFHSSGCLLALVAVPCVSFSLLSVSFVSTKYMGWEIAQLVKVLSVQGCAPPPPMTTTKWTDDPNRHFTSKKIKWPTDVWKDSWYYNW